jgi:hypothetical protein
MRAVRGQDELVNDDEDGQVVSTGNGHAPFPLSSSEILDNYGI